MDVNIEKDVDKEKSTYSKLEYVYNTANLNGSFQIISGRRDQFQGDRVNYRPC